MGYNPDTHHRRSIRLRGYDYRQSGAYFITVCTQNRACLFGAVVAGEMRQNDCGQIVEQEWLRTAIVRTNAVLDAFVVMPNHFHGIIVLDDQGATAASAALPKPPVRAAARQLHSPPSGALGAIIAQVKASVTKRIHRLPAPTIAFAWQRNYFEQIIRDDDQLNQVRDYIVHNPARWQIAEAQSPISNL